MNPVLFNRVVESLLLPPGLLIALLLAVLVLWRFRRTAQGLLVATLAILYLLSVPATAHRLMDSLERRFAAIAPDSSQSRGAEAIVVLGAGRYPDAPEYGGDTVSGFALERLRYAAALHRRTGLPILVSGGATMGQPVPEAKLMRQTLVTEFGIKAVWTEERSRTTAENGRFSAETLAQRGVYRVLLVTHALHMARAEGVFQRAGLDVVPAPTGFHQPHPMDRGVTAWLPRFDALRRSNQALHEYLGMLWYYVRGF